MDKVRGIESIRGVLALTVFLCYAWIIFVGSGSTTGVGQLHSALNFVTRFAVVFFFAVSGFVIAMTIDRNRQRGFRATDYWLSRAARILPPLLAVIGITFALHLALVYSGLSYVSWGNAERASYHTDTTEQLLAVATTTLLGELQGKGLNGPLWSLTMEVRLYVVAGLLAVVAFGRWKAIAVAALVAYLWCAEDATPVAGKSRQLAMAACFGAGAAAYRLRRARLRVPTVVAAAMLGAQALFLPWRNGHVFLDTPGWLAAQVLAASIFSVALVAAMHTHRLDAWAWLGRSSYTTLYILHFPLLLAIYFVAFNLDRSLVFGGSAQVVAVLSAPIVFGVCVAVARVVEQPAKHRAWLVAVIKRARLRAAAMQRV